MRDGGARTAARYLSRRDAANAILACGGTVHVFASLRVATRRQRREVTGDQQQCADRQERGDPRERAHIRQVDEEQLRHHDPHQGYADDPDVAPSLLRRRRHRREPEHTPENRQRRLHERRVRNAVRRDRRAPVVMQRADQRRVQPEEHDARGDRDQSTDVQRPQRRALRRIQRAPPHAERRKRQCDADIERIEQRQVGQPGGIAACCSS